jgi:protein-S-isoprenylcysteine O-methyltransferase Ste14
MDPRALGWLELGAGAAVLFDTFARFVIEGMGTAAPTERLVVGGLYRFVRNPVYLAVAAIILGQAAAVFPRWVLVGYAVVFGLTVWSFVHWYEEPTLRRHFRASLRPVPRHRAGLVASPAPAAPAGPRPTLTDRPNLGAQPRRSHN